MLVLFFWWFQLLLANVLSGNDDRTCNLIVKISPRFGAGVYAGTHIPSGKVIQHVIGIPIPISTVFHTELINYVEGHNETHASVTLGYSMMFNSSPMTVKSMVRKEMLYFYSSEDGVYSFSNNRGVSEDMVLSVNHEIFPGEQLFLYYGSSWFEDRNMRDMFSLQQDNVLLKDSMKISMDNAFVDDQLVSIPGCATLFTYFDATTQKLHAATDIPRGTIIEVSRALLLPEEAMVNAEALTDFLWWSDRGDRSNSSDRNPVVGCSNDACEDESCDCGSSYEATVTEETTTFSSSTSPPSYATGSDPHHVVFHPHTRYATLLLGNGALYSSNNNNRDSNPDSNNNTSAAANVQYNWWDIPCDTDELACVGVLVYKEDYQHFSCSTTMFVAFSALRDIAQHEVLTIDIKEDCRSDFDGIRQRCIASNFAEHCMVPATITATQSS